MREVSCRPVRSDEEMLTGAPRCSRILTFRSLSMPDTGLGEVFAGGEGDRGEREASEYGPTLQHGVSPQEPRLTRTLGCLGVGHRTGYCTLRLGRHHGLH